MHARSKTLSLSFLHLFLPYLVNDSQTISLTIHFPKPILCVTLICGDWFNWSVSLTFHNKSSVCEGSAALFISITGETAILKLQKRHLVAIVTPNRLLVN